LCLGTILWPIQTLKDSLADTQVAIDYFAYPKVYSLAVLLALAPVLLWLRRYDAALFKRAWFGIAAAVLLSLPLFMMAVDWGRFIQIHMVSSAMVLTLLLVRQPRQVTVQGSVAGNSGQRNSLVPPAPLITLRHPWVRRGAAAGTLLFALAWNMPVCCQNSVGLGLIEKVSNSRVFVNVVSRYLP
jgi:hypothetical protein